MLPSASWKKMTPKTIFSGTKTTQWSTTNKLQYAQHVGQKVTDGHVTTSNFVRHLKLDKGR